MKLTGRDGILRIYDSSINIMGTAPLANETIKIVKWDGASTYTDITSDVEADDASAATAFIADSNDAVFLGATSPFAMYKYLQGAGSNYGVATGVIKGYYFNGTNFNNTITITDGTLTGGNCFAQDGYGSFNPPKLWTIGANSINATLTATYYWIKLMTTTSGTTDPDADVLAPVDGQYYEVPFAAMDFSGPIGRAKTEEILILNRNKMDAKGHYIEGGDDRIYEAVPVTFSAFLDDTYNRTRLFAALSCANPGADRWTATGTTTKGNTKNDGTNFNPTFVETAKKTVNIQIIWKGKYLSGSTGRKSTEGMAYYECFAPPMEQMISEAEDAVTLACNLGCFGVIERITAFGVRY